MPRSKTDFTNFIDTRPNYFPGQYLLEDDFEIQHQYLSDRQLYHRQSLHVAGILEGLEVESAQGQKAVSIKSGSAIDGNGNLIVFKKDTVFSSFGNVTTGELYIQYTQVQQVKQQNDIPDSFTRWQEVPVIQFAAKAPDNAVKLANLAIANDIVTVNLGIRVYSGVFLPNPTGNDLTLRSGGSANPNLAVLNGNLSVTGDFSVTGAITGKIDTANITSGILNRDRIPNLSADKITSGTLNSDRIPNLSADKITSGTVAGNFAIGSGNLTVSGGASIGTTTIGSTINIDLSGHLQLKEYGSNNLAFLQARDDNSNRDIGLRLRTQTKSTGAKPTLVEALTIAPSGNVLIGAASDVFKLNVQGDQYLSGILAIGDIPSTGNNDGSREWMTKGIKVFWNSDNLYLGLKDEGNNRKDAVIAWGDDADDNLRFIFTGYTGSVQGSEVMRLKSNGDLSVIGNLSITGNVDIKGTMTGAGNAYQKAQFTMSGGGTVTWEGSGGRLKWTQRFIAISMENSVTVPAGHINVTQPTTDIPATQVYDGVARSANANGILLKSWEALYAVHKLGGSQVEVSFQIVYFDRSFNAPSNWLLVAVINGDDNTVKLGTGAIIRVNGDFFGNLSFGATTRQMINLWTTEYGIGIQDSTQYFRTGASFAWYKGGSHNNAAFNAGGGTAQMLLDANGTLTISGAITPSVGNDPTKGIMFPTNPGGGGGDAAWIRYYVNQGESCTLEVAIENDADDILYLRANKINSKVAITVSSSCELKENISELSVEEALETIQNLRPVKYDYKAIKNSRANLGFIAEEMPDNLASSDRKTISPMEIIPVLTTMIQEQQRAIQSLQKNLYQLTVALT